MAHDGPPMTLTTVEGRLPAALAEAARRVEAKLDLLLPVGSEPEARLDEAMRYACLGGGKRLRAFLVMQTAALFGVAQRPADRVAAAVEMLHAYSLVHDDLPAMDDDDLRRGRPTLHKAFDEATAILAGDALQARAFEVLADPDTHGDAAVRIELVRALAHAVGARGMAGGQMIDLLAPGKALSEPEVARLQMLKTGRLIAFCCEAGAILGKASHQAREKLFGYGRELGLAFQIADDLLDLTGDEATLGKKARKDQAAGKATLVGVLGAERAADQARMLARQACDHLDMFEDRGDLLRDAAVFVVERRH
jgi:farnesyl diphosphate synthase